MHLREKSIYGKRVQVAMFLGKKVAEFARASARCLCEAKHALMPGSEHPWPDVSRQHGQQSEDVQLEMLKHHPYCSSTIMGKDSALIAELLQEFAAGAVLREVSTQQGNVLHVDMGCLELVRAVQQHAPLLSSIKSLVCTAQSRAGDTSQSPSSATLAQRGARLITPDHVHRWVQRYLAAAAACAARAEHPPLVYLQCCSAKCQCSVCTLQRCCLRRVLY